MLTSVLMQMSGLLMPLIAVTFVRSISFTTYNNTKLMYSAWMDKHFGVNPVKHLSTPGNLPNVGTLLCSSSAGATAGLLISTVACQSQTAACTLLVLTDVQALPNSQR